MKDTFKTARCTARFARHYVTNGTARMREKKMIKRLEKNA